MEVSKFLCSVYTSVSYAGAWIMCALLVTKDIKSLSVLILLSARVSRFFLCTFNGVTEFGHLPDACYSISAGPTGHNITHQSPCKRNKEMFQGLQMEVKVLNCMFVIKHA